MDECVWDTGAILGEPQEAVGAADTELGAGGLGKPSPCGTLSVRVASGHKG